MGYALFQLKLESGNCKKCNRKGVGDEFWRNRHSEMPNEKQ